MDSEAVMRLSTKARVAVTTMMELAIRGQVTLRELLASQGISVSYIEQIFARLRRQGLVRGIRGPSGGYRLARSASEITVAEIITSAEEPLAGTYAGEQGTGPDEKNNLSYDLCRRLSGKIYDFLNGITLAQCVEQPRPQAVERGRERQHERKWSDT
jgi:Rrf2 family iron-sulfur cluster assembly transcriptional regulator